MSQYKKYAGETVFGLDIGTRSIVGTVGYKKGDIFHVIAQRSKEHETRAMLDGQIHDIMKVGHTIEDVKRDLEEVTGISLKKVCIAAAGRVLRTVTVHYDLEFPEARTVTGEDVFALKTEGIQKAYEEFPAQGKEKDSFYCVGSTVIRYYMNGNPILNPEEHKAESIGADIIATFLPDDVIDGLYKAVGVAGLEVATMTLEPIAAIQVAIPEKFRMLNLALIDVGAGTSDICITQDGSVIAYGMIPMAGDGLTEIVAKACLVDFATAEEIKCSILDKDEVTYTDIMGLPQKITKEKVLQITKAHVKELAKAAADKIKELNGGQAVSAVFIVGGGGKIPGYAEAVADELGIMKERVALRGEEVMGQIEFEEEGVVKDSLLVTPIGICLNYYEQSNNFIFVTFNHQRIKLYNNDKLAVVDAALQADYSNERLFPRRGAELTFSVNKKQRTVKGQLGEAAVIKINGKEANIYAPIHENDVITVVESTAGEAASVMVQDLPEFRDIISVQVQDNRIDVPKVARVNGNYQSGYYSIQNGDEVEILDYCTAGQILEFMDVLLPENMILFVNHKVADRDTKVYEHYLLAWHERGSKEAEEAVLYEGEKESVYDEANRALSESRENETQTVEDASDATSFAELPEGENPSVESETAAQRDIPVTIHVNVNGGDVELTGKPSYVFVDVFDHIDFDLKNPQGPGVDTILNGREAQYMEPLHNGDTLTIRWRPRES